MTLHESNLADMHHLLCERSDAHRLWESLTPGERWLDRSKFDADVLRDWADYRHVLDVAARHGYVGSEPAAFWSRVQEVDRVIKWQYERQVRSRPPDRPSTGIGIVEQMPGQPVSFSLSPFPESHDPAICQTIAELIGGAQRTLSSGDVTETILVLKSYGRDQWREAIDVIGAPEVLADHLVNPGELRIEPLLHAIDAILSFMLWLHVLIARAPATLGLAIRQHFAPTLYDLQPLRGELFAIVARMRTWRPVPEARTVQESMAVQEHVTNVEHAIRDLLSDAGPAPPATTDSSLLGGGKGPWRSRN